jgi:DNA-binding response OmpR family regulator
VLKGKKKILIVEDEEPLARVLELKLGQAGFETEKALNGLDASKVLEKKNQFDAVVLDLALPGKDGFAILEELKEHGSTTPVIVLSNLAQEEDRKRVMSLGAHDYFVKAETPLVHIVEYMKKLLSS